MINDQIKKKQAESIEDDDDQEEDYFSAIAKRNKRLLSEFLDVQSKHKSSPLFDSSGQPEKRARIDTWKKEMMPCSDKCTKAAEMQSEVDH